MTDFNNGAISEGTNIMVEALANPEKLLPEGERWYYTKHNNDADVDDNFTNYVSNHNQTNDNPQNNDNNDNHENIHNDHNDNNDHNYYGDTANDRYSEKKTVKSDTNKFIDEEYENLSSLEKRLRRLDIMRALGELRDLGCKVTNYNIDDDYYMMKYELDLHRSIRAKRNWLGLYSHMLVGVVKGVELLNNNYNPFDFTLKGLSDEVSADKNTYYEILGEIYEFHNVPGKKMNPWFRLFVSLIGAVVMVGGKNNAHKFIPNQSAKFENDEDFVEKLRAKAAKDSRSQLSHNSQNRQNQQNQNQENHLDEYMNKQHQQAAQKAKDLEELKRQELEYQRYQQMLMEQKDKFNQIKKNLEMTASPRSVMSSKSKSTVTSKSNKSPVKSKKDKDKDKDTISQMSSSTNQTTQSTQSTQSTMSKISINRNLARKLSQKSQSDISVDQISFGSNRKK